MAVRVRGRLRGSGPVSAARPRATLACLSYHIGEELPCRAEEKGLLVSVWLGNNHARTAAGAIQPLVHSSQKVR